MKTLYAVSGTIALCICLNSCMQMPTKIYRKGQQSPPAKVDSTSVKTTALN